jgi:hypothetical protein
MTSRSLVLLASVALAGCPLPQPLPDYPPGTITPPRILVDVMPGHERSVILVPAGCPAGGEPSYPLSATIYDVNTIETVEARWFVNYDASRELYSQPVRTDSVHADEDPLVLTRVVPPDPPIGGGPFMFRPYERPPPLGTGTRTSPPYDEEGTVRVVELVVSNGFDPRPDVPLPMRTPRPGFETQVHRWVYLLVSQAVAPCF